MNEVFFNKCKHLNLGKPMWLQLWESLNTIFQAFICLLCLYFKLTKAECQSCSQHHRTCLGAKSISASCMDCFNWSTWFSVVSTTFWSTCGPSLYLPTRYCAYHDWICFWEIFPYCLPVISRALKIRLIQSRVAAVICHWNISLLVWGKSNPLGNN